MAAAIYSLFIINKSGGLIFYKDYGSAGRMDTNDSLRLASLWHSMHAISQQLSPVLGCQGIELLEADTFDLHCFQSLTGTKFFVVCEPGTQHMDTLLKIIYELYTDYVLKNPFYEMEMPIRTLVARNMQSHKNLSENRQFALLPENCDGSALLTREKGETRSKQGKFVSFERSLHMFKNYNNICKVDKAAISELSPARFQVTWPANSARLQANC
ncbi:trafficking protein particle complex subunit 4-like isoform X2 [Papaver somniferum]|uniref:trafficking protein particle complex subunit 4-like isoform X2 n=1 Tax=Papaver somniferum TaxID=3469 RepID=UPI000E70227E|nr:trafficking protein particle complex subunit 4-like isoform X2 [Papaver somniferum]